MDIESLTDEQIAKLTPEQITQIEEDPDSAKDILAGLEKPSEEPDEKPEQEDEDSAANGAGDKDEDEEQEQEDKGEEEKPVVLTKSGKGTIPYEKYKELRVQNAELRDKLQSLQKMQADLEALRAQQAQAKTPERRAELKKKLSERVAALKEDFPDIGESLTSVNEIVDDLERQIEEDKAEAKRKAEEEAAIQKRLIAEQVQEAKENNPYLSHWEAHDEDAWEEAMMQDEILRHIPKWAKKSYDERFAEVVKRVKAILPEASDPPNAEPSAKTKEKAKAKLEKAETRKPTTLSDIKGGANPASEREQLENLNPFELAQKLMNMPQRQAAAMRADLD